VEGAEMTAIWQEILINWGPMLLLIGVWVFFLFAMRNGTARGRKLSADQIAEAKRQSDALERIATALEKLKP
jgi:ATP-dependent Zn protease